MKIRRVSALLCSCVLALGVLYQGTPVYAQAQIRIVDKDKINEAAVTAANELKVNGTVTIAAGAKVQITDGVDDALVSAGKALLVDASATTQPVSGTVTATPPTTDPCDDPAQAKTSAVIAVTADAQVIAASGSTVIYVCHWDVSIAGTAPTARWIYGTGSVCATGLTALTGAYAALTGTFYQVNSTGTLFKTPASQALCLDTEGTTPSAQGLVTYVQE
jgi:hypothetical protein